MRGRPVSQVEVEAALQDEIDHLEAITNGGTSPKFDDGTTLVGFDQICQMAADAEADWKIEEARYIIGATDKPPGGRSRPEAKHVMEARALALNAEKFRAYKRTAGAKDATKEALNTARARVNALQTISANVRGQT